MTPDDAQPEASTDGPAAAANASSNPAGSPDPLGPVGSVAEEAALLVDLLSRRAWTGDDAARSSPPNGQGGERSGRADTSGSADSPNRGGTSATSEEQPVHECTCGGRTPAACRICPVCQLISFVQQVSPDTIERVADVVDLAAIALRDLATSQRERRGRPGEPPTDPMDGTRPASERDGHHGRDDREDPVP